ncbi:hypothetical protein D9757_006218 [Collybiopsis confluens]|uniref:AP complex mu/sigma subunit domain-containing protein n=1 Tax=Collybiopsis confluens TaxID=2823264 RepID=A0A8H5HK40_9AGAR|nr:hypothetical protein D9757_006218 [Collybiopsis confluens]
MDIFNRIPAISEDALHYILYPPSDLQDSTSITTLAACIQTFVENLLPADFLWHRDAFELKVVLSNLDPDSQEKRYMLEGRIRVGDCVDDEWCTVWLLKELSANWDVAIRISDSDGEFLLIEAAEALPKWVKPSNSENRVWIHRSRLHLIDISHVSAPSRIPRRRERQRFDDDDNPDGLEDDLEDFLASEDALKILRDSNTNTLAPPAVENVVWNRILGYPSAARQHVHATNAYVSLDIAKALSVNPSLIQKAVEAFYTRDGVQLRSAHRMSRFPPHTFVLTTVKMTRTAYAQLVGQKFYPPKIFGRWNEREGTGEWRWRDVGMKTAVGFEILYQENKGRGEMETSADGIRSTAEAKKDALRRNPDYTAYIQNLSNTGYFKGEIQGSQLWNRLEDKAVDIFVNTRKEESSARPSFTTLVNSAISLVPDDFTPPNVNEDSDDWLNIDADNFEDSFQQNQSKLGDAMDVDRNPAQPAASTDASSQLRDLASRVEEFIEGEGDVEGARFADEMFSDEESKDGDSDDQDMAEQEGDEARQAAMDNLVPKLDPSDYGKMPPSFHSNSQRVALSTSENEAADEVRDSQGADSKPIRAPIFPRDTYDGVDSDDETDEENPDEDSEEEEDKPQVVGDIEVDMAEEQDEFLEFSRQALGISDAQWKDILEERKSRGVFVPKMVSPPIKLPSVEEPRTNNKSANAESPTANPNLDSFEEVMKAMEAKLSHLKAPPTTAKKPASTQQAQAKSDKEKITDKGKGKTVSFAEDDESSEEDGDIEAAMEAELKAALDRGEDVDDDDDGLGDANIDYNLIKNFLETWMEDAEVALLVHLRNYLEVITFDHDPRRAHIHTVNTSGVPRLTKFYTPVHHSVQTLVQTIFSLVYSRPVGLCNFLDAPELEPYLAQNEEGEKWRVVYRNYATLYFVFVIDGAESELGILDLIQVFVESLDRAFENVCELDLVFHFDEVHHILAEIIQGGLVLETNVDEIDDAVQIAAKMRKESFAAANPLALGGGLATRGSNIPTPLGWLTGKLAGVGAR